MSRRALVLDGLWYSLCPSFSVLSPARPAFSKSKGRTSNPPLPSIANASSPACRCYSAIGENPGTRYTTTHNLRPDTFNPSETPNHPDAHWPGDQPNTQSPRERLSRTHKVQEDLLKWPNDALETRLQYVMDKKPNIRHITQILRLLIRDRHVQPNARHYKALILANTDNERGSPQLVRGLLDEMEDHGIKADSGTLHGALQVGCLDLWTSASRNEAN